MNTSGSKDTTVTKAKFSRLAIESIIHPTGDFWTVPIKKAIRLHLFKAFFILIFRRASESLLPSGKECNVSIYSHF